MIDFREREKAIILRKNGFSLNEISKKIFRPKSTIRYWCKEIELSKSQIQRLHQRQKLGGALGAEKRRYERIRLTARLFKEGRNDIGRLLKKEILIAGATLYWAEGYRKGDGEFGFTNSDPRMIKFIIHWLIKSCGIDKNRIHLRICINHIHRNRIKSLQKYWSKVTGIPTNQFSKPTLIYVDNKKVYRNLTKYYGTLRIKVRGSTNFRRKIMGWIEGIADNI